MEISPELQAANEIAFGAFEVLAKEFPFPPGWDEWVAKHGTQYPSREAAAVALTASTDGDVSDMPCAATVACSLSAAAPVRTVAGKTGIEPTIYLNERPAFYDDVITLARGSSKNDYAFTDETATFGRFVDVLLTKMTYGQKDGKCILEGAVAGGKARRLAKNQSVNYILMVDVDTGITLGEIDSILEKAGLYAVVWTTHSHMKNESALTESKLETYKNKHGASNVDEALITKYLLEEKHIRADFVAGLKVKGTTHLDGGKHYIVTHQPLPKYRLLFKLSEPFDFIKVGVQSDRILEWSERYAGVCRSLGLPYDVSCTDPSRLMYEPRIPRGSQATDEDGFGIWVFGGNELVLSDYERYSTRPGRRLPASTANDSIGAFEALAPRSSGTQFMPKTPGLLAFVAKHPDFMAADWLREIAEDDKRDDPGGDKVEWACPNEDAHSVPNSQDRAFFATNPGDSETWVMGCRHTTCIEASGKDRLWYLDLACQKYNLPNADALRNWCPTYLEEQSAAKAVVSEAAAVKEPATRADLHTAIEREIDTYTPDAAPTSINLVFKQLALMTRGEEVLFVDRMIALLHTRTGIRVAAIKASVKAFQTEAKKAEKDAQRTLEGGDDTPAVVGAPPVPTSVSTASNVKFDVYSDWHVDERRDLSLRRLQWVNNQKPKIFSTPDGRVTRIITGNTAAAGVRMEEMATHSVWEEELMEAMTFRRQTKTGFETCMPFPECVVKCKETSNRDWPTIEYVSDTPIFGPDGKLYAERGYHPEIKTYVDPNLDYIPPSDVPTDAEVEEARDLLIHNPVRDIPFTDCFGEVDDKPIKLIETEVFEGRVIPLHNMARGQASRANALAMILQPHLRQIIKGPRPGYFINKSAPGTGAGLLTSVASLIANGELPSMSPMSRNSEELKKVITSAMMDPKQTIIFDNINHKIDDPSLALALTAPRHRDRVLGGNDMTDIPNNALWIFTANKGQTSSEIARRMLPIQLNAETPHPDRDRGPEMFKHGALDEWVTANRPKLVWAVHTLIRNWFCKSCPPGTKKLASFDDYARVMGGVLEAAGVVGFMGNIDAFRKGEAPDEDDVAVQVAQLWLKTYGETAIDRETVWDMVRDPFGSTGNHEKLQFGLLPELRGGRDTTAIGAWVRRELVSKSFEIDEGIVTFEKRKSNGKLRYSAKLTTKKST